MWHVRNQIKHILLLKNQEIPRLSDLLYRHAKDLSWNSLIIQRVSLENGFQVTNGKPNASREYSPNAVSCNRRLSYSGRTWRQHKAYDQLHMRTTNFQERYIAAHDRVFAHDITQLDLISSNYIVNLSRWLGARENVDSDKRASNGECILASPRDTHQRVRAPFYDFLEPSRVPTRKMSESEIVRNTHVLAYEPTLGCCRFLAPSLFSGGYATNATHG